jgi:hypothetical protein
MCHQTSGSTQNLHIGTNNPPTINAPRATGKENIFFQVDWEKVGSKLGETATALEFTVKSPRSSRQSASESGKKASYFSPQPQKLEVK